MPKAYRIKNWTTYFESHESRRRKGPLNWVAVPTSRDGKRFRRVSRHERNTDLFAAWVLMLQVAATCEPRGTLIDAERKPLDAHDLADMTGFDPSIFDLAFEALTDTKIGWIETIDTSELSDSRPMDDAAGMRQACGTDAAGLRQVCGPTETGPNRTEQDRTGPDETEHETEERTNNTNTKPKPASESSPKTYNGRLASVSLLTLARSSGSDSPQHHTKPRLRAQIEMATICAPMMAKGGPQANADRTCVAQWFNEIIWPTSLDPAIGQQQFERFKVEASKAMNNGKNPMAYLSTRIGRCKL